MADQTVDSEVMTPAHQHQPTAFPSGVSAAQTAGRQTSKFQQPLAALAGSPISSSGGNGNGDPDVVRQLPEVIRNVLHGCVNTGGYGPVIERGSHLTIYVTSADPAGSGNCICFFGGFFSV